ncbi:hypothetical protein H310_13945 [Aphanomyces invadans]|uniref:Protein kinase domain-containing protein n=1 Tax=Aphanomyces invadans TaxID=157072 RepID=A0A024TBM2_9STRA|nr:hypothetical protein H310_13945 [Aphanomyces invadans]ETV91565.1 hypothetical protein H310_13945 [Aphanomyces invadans]|eukprot:XP_008879833.1 hypothetical protein H310_13945 [Aphanomyces invadans]
MATDGGRRYALFDLVRSGDIDSIATYIRAHHASIRQRSITDALPVQVAMDLNRWDIVVTLVRADPEHITLMLQPSNVSLVQEAIRHKVDESILLDLIAAAPEYIGRPTYTSLDTPKYPIFSLIDSSYVEAAAALVLHSGPGTSPSLNHVTDDDGNSIAHAACKCTRRFPPNALSVLLTSFLTAVNLDGQTPIHVAASSGNLHAVQCAMALTPPSHAPVVCAIHDRAGNLPLHAAITDRQWHVVVPLATWFSSAAAVPDSMGDLPVHIAAGCREWAVVHALVNLAPQTVAIEDRLGRSVLRLALRGAAWDVASTILSFPDVSLPRDVESVDVAVEHAQWQIVGQLVSKRVAVPQPLSLAESLPPVAIEACNEAGKMHDGELSWTTMALDVALRHRQWDVAAWVLATDATAARRKNRMRLLPLQVAAATVSSSGPPDWLLHRLAEAHPQAAVAVDRTGTPLVHVLCRRQNWACVRALVRASPVATTSARDPQGLCAVHVAMLHFAPADVVVDFAIAAPLTTSLDGSTWILHDVLTKYALCLSGSSDVPRLAAAFSTASDMRRNTALHVGLACGHVGFCTALVRDHGVDLFAINAAGDSALDLARRSSDPNLRAVLAPMDVTTLTKATPPPAAWMEKRDARGQSPLVHAALAGHWTGVQWMLQHGADPAPIQALKLPRNVQRAVAASQHAHLVVHHRYVVHTNRVVEIDPSPGDQTCVALDLHTGHSVRLVPFQSKQAQDAYCLQVDSIQRRSPWVCGVLDAFEDDDAFVVVLEGAGHHGDVLDCFQPPEPPLHIAKMLVSAMAALHSGGFVHVCCAPASFAYMMPGIVKVHDVDMCRVEGDATAAIAAPRTSSPWLRYQSPSVAAGMLPRPRTNDDSAMVAVHQTDNLWTLGVMLFELLVAEPFMDPTLDGVGLLVALAFPSQDAMDRRLVRDPALPRPALDVLRGLLSIDPSDRLPLRAIMTSEFVAPPLASPWRIALPNHPPPPDRSSATFLPWTASELVALALQNHKVELERHHRRVVLAQTAPCQATKAPQDMPSVAGPRPVDGLDRRSHDCPPSTSAPVPTPCQDHDDPHDGPTSRACSASPTLVDATHVSHSFVGERVRKRFPDGIVYHGTVSARSAAGDLWTVVYDDGDSEDVTKAELAAILVKKSVKGHVAASDPLAHGQSVWLMHDHQLVARARVCATPPPDLVPSPRGEHNVVCLRITKRFTGTPEAVTNQFVKCGKSATSTAGWFVWWRLSQCFVPTADPS